MRRWERRDHADWAGLTVFVLAVMVAAAILMYVAVTVFTDKVATEAEGRFVSGVLGAAIGVISTYVGGGFYARQRARPQREAPGAVRGDQGGGQQAREPEEQEQGGGDQQRGGEGSRSTESHGQEGSGDQKEEG